ncbi:MAG: HlyD family efflux transporter periplasmic adaptor subunit [Bacteroidales bacterium]|nr:HlyD family efflux transporter periplasmic adaptor subunit [Bacteroidales bacterium]
MGKLKIENIDKEGAKSLEIRSEEMRNVLDQVPKSIVRFGTLIIVLVFIVLVSGSSLLRYPDILSSRIKLTTEVPPAEISANVSARITKIFVVNEQQVKEGEILCILESAARYEDIILLDSMLSESFSPEHLMKQNFRNLLKLGPVQESYAILQKKVKEYENFLSLNYYNRKINSINQELIKYSQLLKSLTEQEKVALKEYLLVQKQYKRDSMLYASGVISSTLLEKSESEMLARLFEKKEMNTSLTTARIEISNLEQEILELELKYEENSKSQIQGIREAYENLKGQILLWEEKYLIRSPFDGKVSFTKIWSDNQYVNQGDIVLAVLPYEKGNIIGRLELISFGAGKISTNQQVIIKFDNYPYLEYGTVTGKIKSISLVPNNEIYSVEVKLDSNQLVTNYGIQLEFRQNMPGIAEIVTKKRSLLTRVVSPFKSAIHRQRTLKFHTPE